VTIRYVAVLAVAVDSTPPGIDPEEFRLALLEDTYEIVADMPQVTAAVATCPPEPAGIDSVIWPGTPVLRVGPGSSAMVTKMVLDGLADLGADEGVVIAGDAPDLPRLLLGKLHRGLGRADVAVCPAEGGGLVAIATKLPGADWIDRADVGLDTGDALDRLRQFAPSRRALSVGPGWRRLRAAEDIERLDPGLEGWEVTRALLSGRRLPS
jgi:hypothetical protein